MPAKPAPLAAPAPVQIDERPSNLPASLIPVALGMVGAGLVTAAVLATVR